MATSELDRLRAENAKLRRGVDSFRATLDQLNAKAAAIERENTILQAELNEERGPGQDGYRKAVAQLHAENTSLQATLAGLGENDRAAAIREQRLRDENTRLTEAVRSALISADVALRALETARGTRSASAVAQTGAAVLTARSQLAAAVARLLGALPPASDSNAIRKPGCVGAAIAADLGVPHKHAPLRSGALQLPDGDKVEWSTGGSWRQSGGTDNRHSDNGGNE